jgi:hypothetical protein
VTGEHRNARCKQVYTVHLDVRLRGVNLTGICKYECVNGEPLVNAKQVSMRYEMKRVVRRFTSEQQAVKQAAAQALVYIDHHIFFHRSTSSTINFFLRFHRAFPLTE